MSDYFTMSPDKELAKALRKNLTKGSCTEALMDSVKDMAAAIGVEVSWDILGIDQEADVNKAEMTKALSRLATAAGAMLAGGNVDAISTLNAQDPMRLVREFREKK